MDGDFLGKVKALLSDPESLERITAIAKGMSSPQAAPAQTSAPEQPAVPTAAASPTPSEPAALPAAARPQSRDSRLSLLEALKPFVSPAHQKRLARALQLAQLSKMAGLALQTLEQENDT